MQQARLLGERLNNQNHFILQCFCCYSVYGCLWWAHGAAVQSYNLDKRSLPCCHQSHCWVLLLLVTVLSLFLWIPSVMDWHFKKKKHTTASYYSLSSFKHVMCWSFIQHLIETIWCLIVAVSGKCLGLSGTKVKRSWFLWLSFTFSTNSKKHTKNLLDNTKL